MDKLEKLIERLKSIYNNEIRTRITNTSNQTSANSFSEAYKNARTQGYKTFVYNGRHYNTDYSGEHHKRYEEDVKSGIAAKWDEAYPNFTHPELRKAKQEELDTYGITNEQTKDRTRLNNNFLNAVSYTSGYANPVSTAINTLLGITSKDRKFEDSLEDNLFYKEHKSNTGYLLGVPQDSDILKISSYRQPGENRDYYYAFAHRNPTEETRGKTSEFSIDTWKDLLKESPYSAKKYAYDNEASVPIKEAVQESLKQINYRVNMLENLKSKYNSRRTNRNLDEAKAKLDNYIALSQDTIPNGNYVVPTDFSMGQYTLGVTDDYKSYGDKWDLNPGRSGNDKERVKVGNPFNLYDRFYKDQTPDIDSIYKEFKLKNK